MKKVSLIHSLFFAIAISALLPIVFVSAQTGADPSSVPTDPSVTSSTPADPGGTTSGAATFLTPATTSTPRPLEYQTAVPAATIPSPTPTATTPQTPATTSLIIPQVNNTPTTENSSSTNLGIIAIISAIVLGALGVLGMKFMKKSGQNKKAEKNSDTCGNIKELLEQKKKELEDMLRNLPKEKMEELGKGMVLTELKKDEEVKKILDTIEGAKDKYEKLKSAIELLEKRLDLCMLSLPSVGKNSYKGTIIENGLSDKSILENIKITKKYGMSNLLLNDVLVNEKQIEKLGNYLNDGPWYMYFWEAGKDDLIVVFKDKSFKIKYSDKATWSEAIQYGKSKGVSEEQLDFVIN